jgi:hypothetical protein
MKNRLRSIQWKKKQMDWEKIEKTNCVCRVFYNMISPFFFSSYKLITIINNNCFIKKKEIVKFKFFRFFLKKIYYLTCQ